MAETIVGSNYQLNCGNCRNMLIHGKLIKSSNIKKATAQLARIRKINHVKMYPSAFEDICSGMNSMISAFELVVFSTF